MAKLHMWRDNFSFPQNDYLYIPFRLVFRMGSKHYFSGSTRKWEKINFFTHWLCHPHYSMILIEWPKFGYITPQSISFPKIGTIQNTIQAAYVKLILVCIQFPVNAMYMLNCHVLASKSSFDMNIWCFMSWTYDKVRLNLQRAHER